MDSWHATFLGLRHLPREVSAFEIEAFYQFCGRGVPGHRGTAPAGAWRAVCLYRPYQKLRAALHKAGASSSVGCLY